MVTSQEIVERSLYTALLNMAIKMGYTVNPEDYLPTSIEGSKRFQEDLKEIESRKGFYIGVFGVGNNQSRGIKMTPRITVEAEGFYPGDVGLPEYIIDKEEGIGYTSTEVAYEALSQYMNIRLVATTYEQMRILHQIMFWSVPQRGYIKPYTEPRFMWSGNIFLRIVNFYNMPDLENGIIEKVYQFEVQDCLIIEKDTPQDILTPIRDISCLLEPPQYTLNIPEN